jgi:lia operon protein LiaF
MKVMWWPLILIVLGVLFLLNNMGVLPLGALKQLLATWWPLILIALGVAALARRSR